MSRLDLTPFVGIPFRDRGASFDGCDCYGLVRLFHREHFDRDLPVAPCVVKEGDEAAGDPAWRKIDRAAEDVKLGDVALIRGARTLHCGLLVDARRILHVSIMSTSVVEQLSRFFLFGIYRCQS